MSLLGVGGIKIVGTGDPDSNTLSLPHVLLDPNFADDILGVHESCLTGFRTYEAKGSHCSFTVTVYIEKFSDPNTTLLSILSYKHKDVYFYPFAHGSVIGDNLGKPIKDVSNANVPCRLMKVEIKFLEKVSETPVVVLTFQSNKLYDLSKSVQ